MSLKRMLLLSLVIGLGLTLVGVAVAHATGTAYNPHPTGETVGDHIAGILVRHHLWTWAPVADRICGPRCGPILSVVIALGLPTIDWAVPAFVILWITTKVRARRAASERRSRTCVKCGYDLRGLPEPRCPECGTPFNPALVGPLKPPT